MADAIRLPLELFYEREARHPNKRYMVQPLGHCNDGDCDALPRRKAFHKAAST